MEKKSLLKVGDTVLDFKLKDQEGKEIQLSDLKGKRILLSFHPLAWTSICAKQMQSLEENYKVFNDLNTVPLGISVDPVPSKTAWAKDLGVQNVRLLSDFWPHGRLSAELGIFLDEPGFSARTNIILDEDHKVAFIKVYETGKLPDINEIIDFLKAM